MSNQQETDGSGRPFPALTPAQRYHLEVYGYVVIENTLSEAERGRLIEALQKLKRDFLATADPINALVRSAHCNGLNPHFIRFSRILEADEAIFQYLTHPRLVGMAEELVGGTVRLEESEAIINSRDPDADWDERPQETRQESRLYRFHTGIRPGFGTYTENGLFHCVFVKTLTNLTELGPDDGGTLVIAGSHKIKCPVEDMIACAYEDRALIHRVTAPAGSTLLFAEALIHATGQIRSNRERVVVIGGYAPMMCQPWRGQEPSDEIVQQTPDPLKPLITGSEKWNWKRRLRTLHSPAANGP
jgi:hypothetical protein